MSSGARNFATALGIISTVIMTWQIVEMLRSREEAAKEKKLMWDALKRIESKLGSKA